jgi:hypothetical protein
MFESLQKRIQGHEARFAAAMLMLEGVLLGIIDALAPNDSVKAFGWLFVSIIVSFVVIYELVWYQRPQKPLLVILGLDSVLFGSLWGIWNATWLFFTVLAKGFNFEVNGRIGIAPYLSLSVDVWVLTTVIALAVVVVGYILVQEFGGD